MRYAITSRDLAGFHVESLTASGLDMLIVSDVSPEDLTALANRFQQAQQSSPPEN